MRKIEIETAINSPDSQRFVGTCATFIPINEEWGVKLFPDKDVRDESYDRHARMYDLGLAPLYGPKTRVKYNGKLKYGYLCEVVECCDKAVLAHYNIKHNGVCKTTDDLDYFGYCTGLEYNDFLDENEKWGTAELELRKNMERTGVCCSDKHAGNWGIRKNGQPVLIDFDKGFWNES